MNAKNVARLIKQRDNTSEVEVSEMVYEVLSSALYKMVLDFHLVAARF